MYQIMWNNHPVGSADVHKEGLFYRIICNCRLPDKKIYRVLVSNGENQYDLGVCVPDGKGNSSRIPCNKLSGTHFKFTLIDTKEKRGIPVATGKAFPYLDRLNNARLHIANGLSEIIIDSVQDQQGNDRNLKHQNKSVRM